MKLAFAILLSLGLVSSFSYSDEAEQVVKGSSRRPAIQADLDKILTERFSVYKVSGVDSRTAQELANFLNDGVVYSKMDSRGALDCYLMVWKRFEKMELDRVVKQFPRLDFQAQPKPTFDSLLDLIDSAHAVQRSAISVAGDMLKPNRREPLPPMMERMIRTTKPQKPQQKK